MPPLASLEDFENRIPGGIDAGDTARAEAALVDASALVRAEAGKSWVTGAELDSDLPDVIITITMAAAKRAFVNPEGIRSEDLDGYRTDFGTASSDVYLTSQEKSAIRKASGKATLWTQPTTRSDPETATVFLEVDPPGDPIPWSSSPEGF